MDSDSKDDSISTQESGTQYESFSDRSILNNLTSEGQPIIRSPSQSYVIVNDPRANIQPSVRAQFDLTGDQPVGDPQAVIQRIRAVRMSDGSSKYTAEFDSLREENTKLKKQVMDLKNEITILTQSSDKHRNEVCFHNSF